MTVLTNTREGEVGLKDLSTYICMCVCMHACKTSPVVHAGEEGCESGMCARLQSRLALHKDLRVCT